MSLAARLAEVTGAFVALVFWRLRPLGVVVATALAGAGLAFV